MTGILAKLRAILGGKPAPESFHVNSAAVIDLQLRQIEMSTLLASNNDEDFEQRARVVHRRAGELMIQLNMNPRDPITAENEAAVQKIQADVAALKREKES